MTDAEKVRLINDGGEVAASLFNWFCRRELLNAHYRIIIDGKDAGPDACFIDVDKSIEELEKARKRIGQIIRRAKKAMEEES